MRGHLKLLFLLIMVSLSLIAQIIDTKDLALFRYQREEIFIGQWWRLLSGHFVHLNWMHLVLNLTGLIVIWLLFKSVLRQRDWWLLTLGSIIVIDLGLLVMHPGIKWYVGLSGILHGLFAGGAMMNLYLYGKKSSLFLVLLIVKLVWEQLSGPLPGSAELSAARVITEAHLYGAIGGLLVVLWLIGMRRYRLTKRKSKHS